MAPGLASSAGTWGSLRRQSLRLCSGSRGNQQIVKEFYGFYPAAHAELCSDLKGTQTWIVVPAVGFDSITIVPLTSRTRSRMLVSPRPRPFITVLISKPAPESLTAR